MPKNKGLEEEVKRKFGDNLRKVRTGLGMSQEKLAFEVEMDLTSINEIERGHRSPKLVTVYRIAKALKIPSSKLLPF